MASPLPTVFDLLKAMLDERREAYERAVAKGRGLRRAHRLFALAKADLLRAELAGLGKAPRKTPPSPPSHPSKAPQMDLFGTATSSQKIASP